MAIARYDHRKLAFIRKKIKKKRKDSSTSPNELELSDGDHGGYLGSAVGKKGGRLTEQRWKKVAFDRQVRQQVRQQVRRESIAVTPNGNNEGRRESIAESRQKAAEIRHKHRRKSSLMRKNPAVESFYAECMETVPRVRFSSHDLCENEDEKDELAEIMMQLELKQKNRERDRTAEEYMEIKTRMTGIMDNFDGPEETEDDDCGYKSDSSGKLKTPYDLRNDITNIIKTYEGVCQERENILLNVYSDLDNEMDIKTNAKDDLLEDNSAHIVQTVKDLGQKTHKLKVLHDKLIKMSRNGHGSQATKDEIESQLREKQIQNKVVGQFKKLADDKEDRKEKLDTWKYAATEIVDLLQSVRMEGSTDIERLECEFTKLVQAFKAQNDLANEFEEKLNAQKKMLQQGEEMKKKANNETIMIQDEYDRCRAKLKTVEMKCQKLEEQLKKTVIAPDPVSQVTPKESESTIMMKAKIEYLQEEVLKYEKLIENEKIRKKSVKSDTTSFSSVKVTSSNANVNPSSQEISQKVISVEECAECEKTQNRIQELIDNSSKQQEEISRLELEVESARRAAENDEWKNKDTKIIVANSTSNTLKPKPKKSATKKRSKSRSKLSVPAKNTTQHSSSDEDEEELEEEVKVTHEKSTQVNFEPQISSTDQHPQHKENDTSNTNNDLNGISSIVDQEFTSIAKKILGYVRVVGNSANQNEQSGHSSVPDNYTNRISTLPNQNQPNNGYGGILSSLTEEVSYYDGDSARANQPNRNQLAFEMANSGNGSYNGHPVQSGPQVSSGNGHPSYQQSNNSSGYSDANQYSQQQANVKQSSQQQQPQYVGSVQSSNRQQYESNEPVDRTQFDSDQPAEITKYGPNQPAAERTQYGSDQPAADRPQYSQPAADRTQYGSNQPSNDRTQYGLNQPAGSTQYGLNQPADSTQFGSNQPANQTQQGSNGSRRFSFYQTVQDRSDMNQSSDPTKTGNEGLTEAHDNNDNMSTIHQDNNTYGNQEFRQRIQSIDNQNQPWSPGPRADSRVDTRASTTTPMHQSRRYSLPGDNVRTQLNSPNTQAHTPMNENDARGEIIRNWEESGFFDEEKHHNCSEHGQHIAGSGAINKRGWEMIKGQSKAAQVLRFLASIGNTKCSHLSEKLNVVDINGQYETAIACKLKIYASHAVDLLDIISFAVKQLDLNSTTDTSNKGITNMSMTMVDKIKPLWKPVEAVKKTEVKSEEPPRRQTLMQPRQENMRSDSFFPIINQQQRRPSRSPRPQQFEEEMNVHHMSKPLKAPQPSREPSKEDLVVISTTQNEEVADKMAQIAEKKRLKILERHKKLVDRLRAGGASTKQIYAILGISKRAGGSDDVIDEERKLDRGRKMTVLHPTGHTAKKMSIVGNAVHNRRNALPQNIFANQRGGYRDTPRFMNYQNDFERNDFAIHGRRGQQQQQMMPSNMMTSQPRGFGMNRAVVPNNNRQLSINQQLSMTPTNHNNNTNTVFPPLQNRNFAGAMGLSSTPLTSLNFFKTKPLSTNYKR